MNIFRKKKQWCFYPPCHTFNSFSQNHIRLCIYSYIYVYMVKTAGHHFSLTYILICFSFYLMARGLSKQDKTPMFFVIYATHAVCYDFLLSVIFLLGQKINTQLECILLHTHLFICSPNHKCWFSHWLDCESSHNNNNLDLRSHL